MKLEQLESREMPAMVFSYTDVDGDRVKLSMPDGAVPTTVDSGLGTFLERLDLTATAGGSVSMVVQRVAGGDGFANVGSIDATGVDIGSVSIRGDLGGIDAGDTDRSTPGLRSLSVYSMGRTIPLISHIEGRLGSVTVKGDISQSGIWVTVDGGVAVGAVNIGGSLIGGAEFSTGTILASGDIGPVRIGGDILGGFGQQAGQINAWGRLSSVSISGSVIGGEGSESGSLRGSGTGIIRIGGDLVGAGGSASGTVYAGQGNKVSVGGSVIGGGPGSGAISGALREITIAGDLRGGLIGNSGLVSCPDANVAISIGGSVIGGTNLSGRIYAANLLDVKIGGDLIGGDGQHSGYISSQGSIRSVTVRGSVIGGTFDDTGLIEAQQTIGRVQIGRDVRGGTGESSGRVLASAIDTVTIGGSVIGGFGVHSGEINAPSGLRFIRIGHDIAGGDGESSGAVRSTERLQYVKVGGSVVGGFGYDSGDIRSRSIGLVQIGGDVRGGFGSLSGTISFRELSSATVGGSVVGNAGFLSGSIHGLEGPMGERGSIGSVTVRGDVAGGSGIFSGRISTMLGISSVKIGGSLIGGTADSAGVISSSFSELGTLEIGGNIVGGDLNSADSLAHTGFVHGWRIGKVTVGGSVISGKNNGGGTLSRSGFIGAEDDIGSITVKGSLVGNASNPVRIYARGQQSPGATDLAIKSLTVGGRVEHAWIMGGVDFDGNGINGNAQIGAVRVGGDWIASNLVSGCTSGDGYFGNDDDIVIDGGSMSRIGSIDIRGQVVGWPANGQTFGFVAQEIGSFKVGGKAIPLTLGASNDTFALNAARPVGTTLWNWNADGFAVHVFEV
jgi:hypothetical protein